MDDRLGKKAEQKIKEWLDKPEDGYSFDRIPDQMTGFYGSSNICDFTLYKYPNIYYIESKATWGERFDFKMLTDTQRKGLLEKSKLFGCYGIVIFLFATDKRAFVFHIEDIQTVIDSGHMSLNITKIDKWTVPYKEIRTTPNKRKQLLDYEGRIEEYV